MGNVCPHGFGCFQSLEEVRSLLHEVINFGYQLRVVMIIMKQETKGKTRKVTSKKEGDDLPLLLSQKQCSPSYE